MRSRQAGEILRRLFKSEDGFQGLQKRDPEPLLNELRALYGGLEFTFTCEAGLHVVVPADQHLPAALTHFARRITLLHPDGTQTVQKDVRPERKVGPSIWDLVRKPAL
jgi:hypothetical protein